MIDRQKGCVMIECDSCPEIFEGDVGEEFDAVWKRAKGDGWKTRKIGSGWVHSCGCDEGEGP